MLAAVCRWTLPPLILLAGLLIFHAVAFQTPDAKWTTARDVPWKVTPRYDWPAVATDAQLAAIMDRMQPPKVVNTNMIVHALRLWGPKAEFHDPAVINGPQMLGYFLDDSQFRARAGRNTAPIFRQTPNGVEARAYDQFDKNFPTSSYHPDDLLATLAESGVSLSTPMQLRDGSATVRDLLEGSLRNFHPQQFEYEWTGIAYARYFFPENPPLNVYGQKWNLDLLLDELCDNPMYQGQCLATHRLEALAVLYRADEQAQALTPEQKKRVLIYMKQASLCLQESQTTEGSWNRKWYAGAAAKNEKKVPIYDKILATGHHLEWLAIAPSDIHPPRETIIRAGQWLVRALTEVDAKVLADHYGPCTHASRALCLWRSTDPYEAWKKSHPAPSDVK